MFVAIQNLWSDSQFSTMLTMLSFIVIVTFHVWMWLYVKFEQIIHFLYLHRFSSLISTRIQCRRLVRGYVFLVSFANDVNPVLFSNATTRIQKKYDQETIECSECHLNVCAQRYIRSAAQNKIRNVFHGQCINFVHVFPLSLSLRYFQSALSANSRVYIT